MVMYSTPRQAVALLCASVLLALCTLTAHATWLDIDIGSPTVAGSHTENGSVLTVTGAGTGEKSSGSDQLHYTYQTNAGGDIDIIARISAFSGNAHARAGIMLRTDNAATTTTAATTFAYQDDSSGKHNVFETARDQTLGYGSYNGLTTKIALPIWIRLVRIGKNFASYRSPDGVIWSMMTNTSGWQFSPTGAIEVGFFAAGGAAGTACTATFDNITISNTTSMGYKSSWYGNSAGGNLSDGHVSNGISSLWTASDGTCYTNSAYDEGGGEAVKVYKDGKVVKSFRNGNEAIGNSSCGEGSITSDGVNIYLAGAGYKGTGLLKTDMNGTEVNTLYMPLTIDPWDSTRGIDIISGLAAANNEVYISDSRAQLVRVATTSIPTYFQAGNTSVNITTQTVSTTGVNNAAPMLVYQSQRECDYCPYVISGFTPNTAYTVRCHFAEFKETQTGKRVMDISAGGQTVTNYDVVAAAGGAFKAAVLDIPNALADGSGNMTVVFTGRVGHMVICGIEILSGTTQVFAINCGGPATGGFRTESYELPSRAFAFTRPGPMVVDTRGDLWIIQEANDFPIGTTMTTKYTGAVLCYHPNGTFTGKQITDVTNPAAIGYDAINDRLLIADNSSNLNIRIYTNLSTTPTFANTFGVTGGLYAGANPGKINDPANGGYARFYGITGVGVDSQGNIYVSCGNQGSDLRKYTSAGALVWMVNGLFFCNCPAIDPDSDGTQAYSTYFHGTLDYNQTAPGSEWSYTGYNWNGSLYGAAPRSGGAQSIMRRVGAGRALIHYTSGQGGVGYVGIFRFNGEIAVPCGQIRNDGGQVWIDTNGNGIEDTGEAVNTATGSPGGLSFFNVDMNGDVWLSCLGATRPILRHFYLKGMTAQGAPIYGTNSGDYEDINYPDPGLGTVSTWGQLSKVNYDSDRDIMYLVGPAQNRTSDQDDAISYLARYDNWSTGNRVPTWQIVLPNPSTDVNFQYETWRPWGCAYMWMGMDVAADKIFIAELWGPVHVFNAVNGTLATILNAGPEVSGSDAWEDAAMGVTAFKRANGEFVVFSENSGFNGKANMWRMPGGANVPPTVSLTSPSDGSIFGAPATITLNANALDSDGSITKVDFYNGATLLGTDSSRPYSYTWSNVSVGAFALTAKATDNSGATTTSATVNITVSNTMCAAPTFTPTAGTYNSIQTVTMSTTTSGASIRYTTDGTTPTSTVGTPYSTPLTFSVTTTLKAIAYLSGWTDSLVTSGVFVINNVVVTPESLSDGSWNFTTIPRPSGSDYFDQASGHGCTISIASGTQHGASAPVTVLNDGAVQANNNDTSRSFFFADATSGMLLADLKSTQTITAVNTYSWHSSGRGAQNYTLYASAAATAPSVTGNLIANGWTQLTTVNAGPDNAQVGVNIKGNGHPVGDYHFLLFTVDPSSGNYYTTFYGEIDICTTIPPTVSLTAPIDGTVYTAPATIALAATAADSDGTVSKVDFYQGSTLLGTANTSPYTCTWSNVAAGSYTLTAKATDNTLAATTSSPVQITVQSVVVTSESLTDGSWNFTTIPRPSNGDYLDQASGHGCTISIASGTQHGASAPVTVLNDGAVQANNNDTSRSFFFADATSGMLLADLKSTVTITAINTYSWHIDTRAMQNYTLYASAAATAPSVTGDLIANGWTQLATVNAGPTNTQVGVNIKGTGNSVGSYRFLLFKVDPSYLNYYTTFFGEIDVWTNLPPTVNLTSPANNSVYTAPASIGMTATASANNGGSISKVEFYNGATLLGTASTSPYSYTWTNVAAGSYTLTAKAYDNTNAATTSSGVNVISDAPPTVSLTAPAANTNYIAPASVALTATASDSDGTISKVEFYQGSTLVGTASTSPYSYTWTNVAMGNYSLTAKAYDNNDVTTTSSAVNIIVWGTSDIGSVGVAGSASYSGGTFTVSGAGAGVTSTADAFRYVYRQFSGNTTIVARVASATSATTAERAGVMMRQNLNANSIEASALYKPTSTYYVYFLRRTSAGGSTSSTTSSTAAAPPYWVKVVRSSNTLSAFMSANGSSWTAVGSGTTVTMTDPIYVGLAVTSGSTSAAKTVTFDNVSITQP